MLGRLAVLGGIVAFARSSKGKQVIAQTREKYDTPENRAKVQQAVSSVRGGGGARTGAGAGAGASAGSSAGG